MEGRETVGLKMLFSMAIIQGLNINLTRIIDKIVVELNYLFIN